MIDRSLGKLVLLHEKIDLLIEKNDRLMNKATLKIKFESLIHKCDALLKEVGDQRKQAVKLEEKMKLHHISLIRKNQQKEEKTEQEEDLAVEIHLTSVQLSNLD